MEKATTCVPVLTAISEGVLPTYLPSRVISAPGGVELKLHLMLIKAGCCVAATGAGVAAGTRDAAGAGRFAKLPLPAAQVEAEHLP